MQLVLAGKLSHGLVAVSIFGVGANIEGRKIHYADRTRTISCAYTKGVQSGCRIRAYCARHAVQLVELARRKLITATMHRTQSTKETAINYFFFHDQLTGSMKIPHRTTIEII